MLALSDPSQELSPFEESWTEQRLYAELTCEGRRRLLIHEIAATSFRVSLLRGEPRPHLALRSITRAAVMGDELIQFALDGFELSRMRMVST